MALTERSLKNMIGIHSDLERVIKNAKTPHPFVITEGLRDGVRQAELLKAGKSRTMNSRHLTGHAADFAVFDKAGKVTWDFSYYKENARAFLDTAGKLGVPLEWGGKWETFKDGTHLQLPWSDYPLNDKQKTPGNSKTIATATIGFPVVAFFQEIFEGVQKITGLLKGIDQSYLMWVQTVALVGIVLFLVRERYLKIRREGV
jgi:peptidoglycan L-alanyl-D-glutamate endopeptidase CwlK